MSVPRPSPGPPPDLLQDLIASAAHWTGFRKEAILRTAVSEVAAAWLRRCTPAQLREAMRLPAPGLVHDICQAVTVGETYFFRTPEQLTVAMEALAEGLLRGPRVRAWSAGCATGEEAYTLSALLAARAGPGVAVEVLGTDLVDRNLELARAAHYGRWSVRRQTTLAQAFHPLDDGQVEVDAEVRQRVTFAQHNLLTPAAAGFGLFDLILCRNVLVYFTRDSAACAAAHLARALSPGGLLVFGSMDVTSIPEGLVRAGPPELQMYRRAAEAPAPSKGAAGVLAARADPRAGPAADFPAARIASVRTVRPKAPTRPRTAPAEWPAAAARTRPRTRGPVPLSAGKVEPVAVHLEVLACVEAEDLDAADRLLDRLLRQDPDYLPALLERALLHLRLGERASGHRLMRDLLARSSTRPADELLAAPEPVTVAFLRASAQAALKGTA